MYHQLEEIKEIIAARNFSPIENIEEAEQYEHFSKDLAWIFSNPESFQPSNFNRFNTQTILTYLRKTHAFYTKKCLDEIAQTIDQLRYKTEAEHFWKPVFLKAFSNYASELCRHIEEEEQELFPYIDSLIAAQQSCELNISFERKVKLINHLVNHTDDAEQKLRSLINLLENKSDQFESSLSLNVLISKLRSLERDLVVHAKIEDEVLLPKALELEKAVLANSEVFIK